MLLPAFSAFFHHSPLVSTSSCQHSQSHRSDSPELLFDLPSLVLTPVCFDSNPVRLDPSPFSADSLRTLIVFLLQLQPALLNAVILIFGQCVESVSDLNAGPGAGLLLDLVVPEFRCVVQFPPLLSLLLHSAQFQLHPCQNKMMATVGVILSHRSGVKYAPPVSSSDYDVVHLVKVAAIR